MSRVSHLLFVYGTLMRGLALHHLLDGQAEFVGAASIRGRLVDLDGYPGALADRTGRIRGELYRLQSARLLPALDSAEGLEFPRRLTPVRLDGGRTVRAWVYWFGGATRGAVPIQDGDYRRHATARALPHSRLKEVKR